MCVHEEAEVVGLELASGSVRAVSTIHGDVRCDHVVLACGLWARDVWSMLARDCTVAVRGVSTPLVDLVKAQEGDFALRGVGLQAAAGHEAPVIHFDAEGPLRSDRDGRVLVEGAWGVYFRMGRSGTSVIVGGLP